MARELRRLLVSPERLAARAGDASGSITLSAEELHYLQRVLRLRDGDALAIVDGAGHLWRSELRQQQAWLQEPLAQPACSGAPPQPRLQLAVALPRRDSDVLLRMATELGIDRIQPLLAERSVVERWNAQRSAAIVREAVEQCERLWAPELAEPVALAALLPVATGLRLWATTRHEGLSTLAAALDAAVDGAQDATPDPRARAAGAVLPALITVAIGPEGGWSPAEEAAARLQGWQPVQLGPAILRSSTAAVAAATLLCSWRSRLSS